MKYQPWLILVGITFGGSSLSAHAQVPTAPAPTPVPMPVTKPAEWPREVDGKDLKGWLAELKDSTDGAVREHAVKMIPQFGPPARKECLDPLLNALRRETDPGVKVNLMIVVGSLGPENATEGKKIVDLLKVTVATASPGSPYRLHAVRGLIQCANYAIEAIPELKLASEDSSWETRRAIVQALGILGRPLDEKKGPNTLALDTLTSRMKLEKSAAVRLEVVQSLLMVGPPAFKDATEYAKVIGPYFKAVNDQIKAEKDKAIQVWLTMLLMRYDGSQLTDATIKKIADHIVGVDLPARFAALRALALLDDRAKPFVPLIIDALKMDDPSTVAEAMNALAALRTHSREALPELEKLKAATKDELLKDLATQAIDTIVGRKPVPAPAPKK